MIVQIYAFLFRYWDLKKFGISDNFTVMDDDYFIGKKLKKTDFFYVNDGKILPSIINSNFFKIDKNSSQKKYDFYKKRTREN